GAPLDERDDVVGRLGLDHHDRDVGSVGVVSPTDDAAGDDHVEDGVLELLDGRERDPLPRLVVVGDDERDTHATDRAGERQTGELGGGRRGVDRDDVVEVVRVQAQNRDDDLDLVAQTVNEGRAQRPVDQTAGQDRVGGGASLATEERAGDATRGVHALLDVHRQREEVELVLGLLRGAGGREQHGLVVEIGDDRTGGLTCEAAGLETDRAGAVGTVVERRGGLVDPFVDLDCGSACHLYVFSSLFVFAVPARAPRPPWPRLRTDSRRRSSIETLRRIRDTTPDGTGRSLPRTDTVGAYGSSPLEAMEVAGRTGTNTDSQRGPV